MILWPPLFGLWGGPWPLGPPPKYASGITQGIAFLVTVPKVVGSIPTPG